MRVTRRVGLSSGRLGDVTPDAFRMTRRYLFQTAGNRGKTVRNSIGAPWAAATELS
jgi:hypothetical protein